MTDLLDPRVEEIFDAVANLAPGERERALEERCGGEEELKRRVLALLACDTPSGFEGAATIRPVAEERIGTRIGPYEIVGELGEGGMGTVYLAEQVEPIRRRVALKIIKLGMDTRRVIARFEMERQVLALLDHGNIARVLDAGATERGRPYFVMELVEGEPLTAYCDARSLPVPARLQLFLSVCRAVQHAHQRGIIHRDLKPSNVLVREVEGRGVPKVIDFGVAKAIRSEASAGTTLTEHHQVIGTPEYMSPEQAGFGDREVDTRSDVYSLGVLLYELLAGDTPHSASVLGRANRAEIHRTLREVVPSTPSRRLATTEQAARVAALRASTPRALRRRLRAGLDWIALKCLEKEKGRRYDSAAALAHDIECYLADRPLAAGPPDVGYRIRTFARRHSTALGIAAAVAIAFLAVVGGFLRALYERSEEERRARERAEAALRANQIERGRLLGLTGSLALAEDLLWNVHLESPDPASHWALWELYSRYPCLATRDVAGGCIDAVAFRQDGSLLATGQRDGIVRLWRTEDLRTMATLEGHRDEVHGVAFLPGDDVVASASFDGTVRIWDVATGKPLRVLEASARLQDVAVSNDGRFLAAAGEDGIARVWEVSTGHLRAESAAAPAPYRTIRFDGSGGLICGRDDGTIDLLDERLARVHELVGHDWLVLAIELDATGNTLYSCGADRTFRVWDLAARTGRVLEPGIGSIHGIARMPDGGVFLLGNRAVERRSRDLQDVTMTVRISSCSAIAASRSLLCLVGAGVYPGAEITGRIRLLETEPGLACRRSAAHGGIAYALAVSPKGVVTGGDDGRVLLDGAEVARHDAPVHGACFTPDGRHLVTASKRGEVLIHAVATGAVVARCRGFSTAGSPLAMAPAGDRFLTGDRHGVVREWAVPSGNLLREHAAADEEIVALAFRPDGARFASAARDKAVRVWDARTLRKVAELPHDVTPWTLEYSPDGRTLAVGTWAQVVRMWDPERGEPLGELRGHHGLVRDVAFAPAALGFRALVSASDDGTLKLWDLDALTCVLTLPLDEPAYSVAFLDGTRLVSTHGRGTVAEWDLGYCNRHVEGNREHQERMRASR